MLEGFTDEARKVMALANQEAQRFNHEYIGTEHILLGLIKEGSGIGATTLKNLNVDIKKARSGVENLVKPGPDMVTMGKLSQTPLAKKTIEEAINQARSLNHNYIGTGHIGLALYEIGDDTIAYKVLSNLGVTRDAYRNAILGMISNDLPEENQSKNKSDFWRIPKEKLSLVGLVKLYGFEIEITSGADIVRSGGQTIGKLPSEIDNNPVVLYEGNLGDPNNPSEINEVLRLRNVFEEHNVKYDERPTRNEVVNQIKESIKEPLSLIERIEGKKKS